MKIVSFVLFLLKIFIEASCLNRFISFLLSALNTAKRDQNIVLVYTLEVTVVPTITILGKKRKIKYIPVSPRFTI